MNFAPRIVCAGWSAIRRNSGELLLALGLLASLNAYEGWVVGQGFGYLLDRYLNSRHFLFIVSVFVAYELILLVYFWISFLSKGLFRWAYLVVFSAATFAEYGYVSAIGRYSQPNDVFVANYATIANAADMILTFLDIRAVVPCLAYAAALVYTRSRREFTWGAPALLASIMCVALPPLDSVTLPEFPRPSTIAFFRSLIGSAYQYDFGGFWRESRHTLAYRSPSRPRNNIVLIIDESVNGAHLGINGYERPTTPFLDRLSGKAHVYNYGLTCSAGTASYLSNVLLLTGVRDLPDRAYRTEIDPMIFQYAQAMNYRTHYFGAQVNGRPEDFRASDMAYIDQFVPRGKLRPGENIDLDIACRVRSLLAKPEKGQFIVIQKYGIHWHFARHYALGSAIWLPDLRQGRGVVGLAVNASGSYRQAVINTYDNALCLTLNPFFEKLLPEMACPDRTIILYTSDHGQAFGEGGHYFHGGSEKTMATVPLLLISSQALDCDTRFRASHFNLFATMLDLMGFPEKERACGYEPSLLGARQGEGGPRRYFTGPLHGRISDSEPNAVGGWWHSFDGAK